MLLSKKFSVPFGLIFWIVQVAIACFFSDYVMSDPKQEHYLKQTVTDMPVTKIHSIEGKSPFSDSNLFIKVDYHDEFFDTQITALLDQPKWQKVGGNQGFNKTNDGRYLFASSFTVESGSETSWMIKFNVNRLEYLGVYLYEDGVLVNSVMTGMALPFDTRTYEHRNFVFPIKAKIGSVYHFVMDVRSYTGYDNFIADIIPINDFYRAEYDYVLETGFYFGVVALVILYNLLFSYYFRDFSYLLYVSFISLVAGFFLTDSGFLFQYVWPDYPQLNQYSLLFFSHASYIVSCIFAIIFLDLKNRLPVAHKIAKYMAYFIGFVLVIGVTISSRIWGYATILYEPYLFAFFVVCGVMIWRQGHRHAIIYAIAYIPISLFFVYYYMMMFSLLSAAVGIAFITIVQAAFTFEMIVLVFALGDRIGQLKMKETKAVLESNIKSDFVAQMSHEIRTPMNGILGISELLNDHLASDKGKQYNKILQQSGKVLLQIINDILDFSKIESGKLKVESIPFSLGKIIEEDLLLFKNQVSEKNVALCVEMEDGFPEFIYGDPNRVQQIIFNLVNNAIKFTEKGSVTIKLNSCGNGDKYRLSVKDTGTGIKAENMEGLFGAYVQEDTSISRRYGGTGLGLTICSQLAEIMGGKIFASSIYMKGSEFWIELPLDIAPKAVDNSTEDIGGAIPFLSELSILVVDDNNINLMMVSAMLEKMLHKVECKENGLEALEHYREHHDKFDAVFMDCEMPIMDGYIATEEIRKFEKDNNLPRKPVIALTAHVSEERVEACLKCGMDRHLHKPISMNSLSQVLEELAGKNSNAVEKVISM